MNDNDGMIPEGVTTMVGRELTGAYRDLVIITQAKAAEARLAPVLKVMRETGLIAAGYKAALADQMPAVHWDPGDVPAAAWPALQAAREMIRDRIDLTAAPDALIVLNHAVIALLGDAGVGSVSGRAGTGWELC